jgi:hypothetical protein
MDSNVRQAFGITCAFFLLSLSGGVLNAQTPGWTAGTGKITTSDNIGIGTATPDAQLHILGGATLFKAIPASDWGSGQSWGTYIRDTLGSEGYSYGTALDFTGNSLIRVSNLRIGYLGWPEIESMSSTTPLYLNLWNGSDVVVSNSAFGNGLRVEGRGASSFVGNVGIGNNQPGAKLEVDTGTATEGIRLFSGNASSYTAYSLGRTAVDMYLGVAAGGGQWVSNSAAGDVIMRAQSGRLLFTSSPIGSTNDLTLSGGNVAIGTTVPTALLTVGVAGGAGTKVVVNGDISVGGGINGTGDIAITPGSSQARVNGNFTATSSITIGSTVGDQTTRLTVHGGAVIDGNIAAKYQDVAEWVPASAEMPPGTVVVLNREKSNEVMPSVNAYDTGVAGVVSAQPGLILGEAGRSKAQIATTGRVKVRVDASRSPIRVGDLLVTSDKAGTAMRSEPLNLGGAQIHRPGTLIGKALEPLASGQGEILALLSLQ